MRPRRADHERGGLDISAGLKLLPAVAGGRSTSLPLDARRAGRAGANLLPPAGYAAEDLARGSVRPPSLQAVTGHDGGPYSPALPYSPCGSPPPSSRRRSGGTTTAVSSKGARPLGATQRDRGGTGGDEGASCIPSNLKETGGDGNIPSGLKDAAAGLKTSSISSRCGWSK
jgi:hypothetical protein